jgi:hypothetical protein
MHDFTGFIPSSKFNWSDFYLSYLVLFDLFVELLDNAKRLYQLTLREGFFVSKKNSLPKKEDKTRFEKIDQAVKFAGGVAGLLTALIKIFEFAAAHWRYTGDVPFQYVDGQVDSCKQFQVDIQSQLDKGTFEEIDLEELARRFNSWCVEVPRYLRAEIEKEFGYDIIVEVRKDLPYIVKARQF